MGNPNTVLLFNTLNQSISSFLSKWKGRNYLLPWSPPRQGTVLSPQTAPGVSFQPHHFCGCSSSHPPEQTKSSSGPFLGSSGQTSPNSSGVCSLAMRKGGGAAPLCVHCDDPCVLTEMIPVCSPRHSRLRTQRKHRKLPNMHFQQGQRDAKE